MRGALNALTMGSTRLWLPSLRSVDSQRGGFSIVLLGHVLSGRCNGLKGRYFVHGSASIGILSQHLAVLFFYSSLDILTSSQLSSKDLLKRGSAGY
jgi:hypothetical protein